MAITDTLTDIKDFFLNWHKDNYAILHEGKTTEVTNQQPNNTLPVTSGAVYDYFNTQKRSIQSTLDQFDERLTNINSEVNNKLNKTQYANATIYNWNFGDGLLTEISCIDTQDGLMRWQEKIFLQELGTWHTINQGLPRYCTMEVNIILGLCHFHIYAKNTNKFKNSTVWTYNTSSGSDALQQFPPSGHVQRLFEHGTITIKPSTNNTSAGFIIKADKKYDTTTVVADIIYKITQGQLIEDTSDNPWSNKKRSVYDNIIN